MADTTRITFTHAELDGLVRMTDWALDEGEDDKPTLHGIVKLRNALGRLNFAARRPVSITVPANNQPLFGVWVLVANEYGEEGWYAPEEGGGPPFVSYDRDQAEAVRRWLNGRSPFLAASVREYQEAKSCPATHVPQSRTKPCSSA